MLARIFPDLEQVLVASSGRVRLSAQLVFDSNEPETFAKQQQVALDFVGLMRKGGEVHKFEQTIKTVAELDREPVLVTPGDDGSED